MLRFAAKAMSCSGLNICSVAIFQGAKVLIISLFLRFYAEKFSQTPDCQHGQVVIRYGSIAVGCHHLAEGIDHLLGRMVFHLMQHLLQAGVAILLLGVVFSLV